MWWRYVDEIFFLWGHGEEKLKEFIEDLNEEHLTIKFTTEWSQTSINFLDVTVSLIGGEITTDLYVKPTDSHKYLHSLNFSKTLAKLHLLLTLDVARKAVFTKVQTIGLNNDRSLKDHLVWAVLPKIDEEGRSKSCGGKKCS